MAKRSFMFTSESVTEGHPDKVCDGISDVILDAHMKADTSSRVACETLVSTGLVVVAGEITSSASVSYADIVRDKIRRIGYDDPLAGLGVVEGGVTRNERQVRGSRRHEGLDQGRRGAAGQESADHNRGSRPYPGDRLFRRDDRFLYHRNLLVSSWALRW